MENQHQTPTTLHNQQSDDKVSKLFERIQEVGNLTDNQFILETRKFHKIKNVDRNQYSQMIGVVLAKAINLAGFKKAVDDIHKVDVSKMLLTKYKNITLEEIDKAFEIDRYSSDPVKHFDLFSSSYVAKILDNYQTWKSRKKNYYQLGKEKKVLEISEEQKKENQLKLVENLFKSLQVKEFDRDAWLLYDKIECYQKTDKDYKRKLYEAQLKKYYINQKKDGQTKDEFKTFKKKIQGSNYVKNRCKSIIVCGYLKKFAQDFETFKSKINYNE